MEYLYKAWERYKYMLRRCPRHGLPEWLQLQFFYNGLGSSTKTLVDAAAGHSIMAKTHEVAYESLEKMVANAYQWPTNHSTPNRAFGVHEVDPITALSTFSHLIKLSLQHSQLTLFNYGQIFDSIS